MPEKKQRISKNIKRVDAIVTGLILGWVIASIYGISKDQEAKNIDCEELKGKLSIRKVAKLLIFGVPKEKPTLWQKIGRFFRKK